MARLMPLLMMIMASTGSLMILFDVYGVRAVLIGIFTGPGSVSRIIALLLILTNLKVFPFVWHIRIFKAILQHFFLSSLDSSVAPDGPATLFQPIVTSSRAPLFECDYNFHKSNSTFFADLDVTRIHLLARLFRKGITKLRKTPEMVCGPDGVPAKGGKLMVILGGTHCSFRREIKPFQAYEMWSRILAWDQKWIYVVTHFVKPGSAKPQGYTSNPFQTPDKKNKIATDPTKTDPTGPPPLPLPQDRVLASAISKYVIKLGRLTIHPEVLLHASDLLPTKPGGWHTMSNPTSSSPPAPGPATSDSYQHIEA
ncbi:hypothetical protein MMC29_005215, partial [Sticta canariensis]|nr:hypothetical protein [Sticta canariensis]